MNNSNLQPILGQRALRGSTGCAVSECTRRVVSLGLCKLHYQRFNRTGNVHTDRPCLHGKTEDRFWNYVTKGGADECWEWRGFRDKDGYGKLRDGDTQRGAHIVSFEIHKGPVPEGLSVLHSCDNPPCVNPAHLRPGTHLDNMADRKRAGRCFTGERHHYAKFSTETVQMVRAARGTYKEIGRRFGMSESQVGNIKRGRQRPDSVAHFPEVA